MAFISAYRDRQANPQAPLAVQPGATATSIRIPALPAAASKPIINAGSPPPPSAAGRKGGRPSLAGESEAPSPAGGISISLGGTPAATPVAAPSGKKGKKAAAAALLNAAPTAAELANPTLPADPDERNRVVLERRKAEAARKTKSKQAKKNKEMMKEQEADLQVGEW